MRRERGLSQGGCGPGAKQGEAEDDGEGRGGTRRRHSGWARVLPRCGGARAAGPAAGTLPSAGRRGPARPAPPPQARQGAPPPPVLTRSLALSPLRPSRRHGDRWVRSGPYEADAVGGPARAGAAPARAEAVLENRGAARPPGWRWRWRRPWACGGGREVRREGGGDPRALGRPRHGGTTTGTRLSAPLSAPVGPFLRREGRSPRGVRGRGR